MSAFLKGAPSTVRLLLFFHGAGAILIISWWALTPFKNPWGAQETVVTVWSFIVHIAQAAGVAWYFMRHRTFPLELVGMVAAVSFGPVTWIEMGCRGDPIVFIPGSIVIGFAPACGISFTMTIVYKFIHLTTYVIILILQAKEVHTICSLGASGLNKTSPEVSFFRMTCLFMLSTICWITIRSTRADVQKTNKSLKVAENIAKDLADFKVEALGSGWSIEAPGPLLSSLLRIADNIRTVKPHLPDEILQLIDAPTPSSEASTISQYLHRSNSLHKRAASRMMNRNASENTFPSPSATIPRNQSDDEIPTKPPENPIINGSVLEKTGESSLCLWNQTPFIPPSMSSEIHKMEASRLNARRSNPLNESFKRMQSLSPTFGLNSSIRSNGHTSQHSYEKRGIPADGLRVRNITICSIVLSRFNYLAQKYSTKIVEGLLQSFMTITADNVRRTQGCISRVMGTRVLCSWNAVQDCTNHSHNCCIAALQLLEAWEELKAQWVSQYPSDISEMEWRRGIKELQLHIGIVRSEVLVGNWGSSGMKGYHFIGSAIPLLHRLQDLNNVLGTNIIVCSNTEHAARGSIRFRAADIVCPETEPDITPLRVYECYGVPDMQDGEWMYTLLREEESRMEALHERAFELYMSGQFDLVLSHIGNQVSRKGSVGMSSSNSVRRSLRRLYRASNWYLNHPDDEVKFPYFRRTRPSWDLMPHETDTTWDISIPLVRYASTASQNVTPKHGRNSPSHRALIFGSSGYYPRQETGVSAVSDVTGDSGN
eukprot:NODE_332_length_2950_cov_45.433675_g285_i0.p1 GENE.NODE_332_length_2950_cov_45.433675_g285_i0~~NODE_332_length_2950_cov_45.433675_g285_i0.p1  ORF type:complete len:769 (+),score=133.77 NODE_332_length_2950_cov_45.433675_g285_i0:90-2396(+)